MEKVYFNFTNLSDKEIAEIERLSKKSKSWKPDIGESYYAINNGVIVEFTYDGEDACLFDYEIGNCYKTEEKATFALEKQLFIMEVKRYIQERNTPRQTGGYYYIKYRSYDDEFRIVQDEFLHGEALYFPTAKIAEEICVTFRDDLIKYYFSDLEE